MEIGKKSSKGIKVVELEIEREDTQYLIETYTSVAWKIAQADIVCLQQLLKKKKTMTEVKFEIKNKTKVLQFDICFSSKWKLPKILQTKIDMYSFN